MFFIKQNFNFLLINTKFPAYFTYMEMAIILSTDSYIGSPPGAQAIWLLSLEEFECSCSFTIFEKSVQKFSYSFKIAIPLFESIPMDT